MKRLVILTVGLLALSALAASAINYDRSTSYTTQYTFTNCAAGGSAAQTIIKGKYLVTALEDTGFLCQAKTGSTCASGGKPLPINTRTIVDVGESLSMSCRSASATADITLDRVFLIP